MEYGSVRCQVMDMPVSDLELNRAFTDGTPAFCLYLMPNPVEQEVCSTPDIILTIHRSNLVPCSRRRRAYYRFNHSVSPSLQCFLGRWNIRAHCFPLFTTPDLIQALAEYSSAINCRSQDLREFKRVLNALGNCQGLSTTDASPFCADLHLFIVSASGFRSSFGRSHLRTFCRLCI
jgi:hypothetical protein